MVFSWLNILLIHLIRFALLYQIFLKLKQLSFLPCEYRKENDIFTVYDTHINFVILCTPRHVHSSNWHRNRYFKCQRDDMQLKRWKQHAETSDGLYDWVLVFYHVLKWVKFRFIEIQGLLPSPSSWVKYLRNDKLRFPVKTE